MSNSPMVSHTHISPNRNHPRNHRIDKITVHHMAMVGGTVERCGAVFAPKSRKASSNYGIGIDGRVGLYVDEGDRSWASSNARNDNRAVTIEVANDGGAPDWHVSDASWDSLVELCADICRRNGIDRLIWTGDANGNLTCHYMFAATACPGPYLKGRMAELATAVNAKLGGSAPAPAPQPAPKPQGVGGSTDDLARRVIAGEFGTGDARKQALGSRYDEVQARVNQLLGAGGPAPKPQATDIDQLARDVIAGKYGSGEARKRALGGNYEAVQARVNQMLGAAPAPSRPVQNIDAVARAVIRGDYGNGADRERRLRAAGYDPAAVQRRVNQLL